MTSTAAVRFLHALSQALATSTLYGSAHPARRRAVRAAYESLRNLQSEQDTPSFSFIGRDVICGYDALRELRDWDWGARLAEAGVQRIEIVDDVQSEEFDTFVEQVRERLAARGTGTVTADDAAAGRSGSIRFGVVGVQGGVAGGLNAALPAGSAPFTLREESDAVRYIHAEVADRGTVPMAEAEAVVRSLSVALHTDGRLLLPLLRLKTFDQYTTTHSINVAILTMALAEGVGHSPRDIRALGVAGLLHDLGKVRVPLEILTKPGSLSPEERELLERHPADGARIILNSDSALTLPAAVAFEHHVMIDGGGYPRRHFARDCHYASTMVHVCDVFDALHTDRPYRAAWPAVKALHYIERRAAREFDPTIAAAFIAMVRKSEQGLCLVEEQAAIAAPARPAEPVPLGAPAGAAVGPEEGGE